MLNADAAWSVVAQFRGNKWTVCVCVFCLVTKLGFMSLEAFTFTLLCTDLQKIQCSAIKRQYMMSLLLYGVLWVHLWSLDLFFFFYETINSHHCPAYQAHELCCHLWPLLLQHIFPHYIINGTIFRKKVVEHKMCVLIFCTTFVWNILRRTDQDIINVHTSSRQVSIILVRF